MSRFLSLNKLLRLRFGKRRIGNGEIPPFFSIIADA